MKQRIIIVLICCALLFSLSIPVYAVGTKEYKLDDLDMKVSLPSDYVVFLRDIDENDPNLSAYGLTKDDMSSLMIEQNIYLDGMDSDVNQEITITMIDSPLIDFNLYSDTTLSTIAASLVSEYENIGISIIKSEIYQHSQAKFVKMYMSQPNNGLTVYGLQYCTVYADKAISITMHSYSDQITASQEAVIKSIVDSAVFDTEPQLGTAPAQTESFTYTDEDTGLSFTVPANWIESPMNEDREFLDAKFTSNLEEGLIILFTGMDILASSEYTALEKLLIPRSSLDNSIVIIADVAAMGGVSEKDVSMVTYGGKEYYMAEGEKSVTAYGLTLSTPIVYLVRCENGYMYMFQFYGSSSNTYYKDFEALVCSAKYPEL